MSAVQVLVNGEARATVPWSDRGLAYGDGVFETLLVADGAPIWWDAHLARLQRGCAALGIAPPSPGLLAREAALLTAGTARAVLKLMVTRGAGARGYACAPDVESMRVLSLHEAPTADAGAARDGIAVRWCELALALQPRLAGFKHLNRLEQVLARREWSDPAIAEGLLCDTRGHVTCATAANLFVVSGGRLVTPPLDQCGIAGICRGWLLDETQVEVATLERECVQRADELFLTSSLRGILPIARLDGRQWKPGPMTRRLQHALWRAVPALRPVESDA